MMLNVVSVVAILLVFVRAVPVPHGTVIARGHNLIKRVPTTWSTVAGEANTVDLALESFKPKDIFSGFEPTFSAAPDGSKALQVHFNKGAYEFKGFKGGMSFYATPVDLSQAREVTFSYSAFFSDDFEFNLGGKLPGLYGGDDADTAISCSGGRRDDKCWSARFMFRPQGDAELYTYLPQPLSGSQFSGNKQLCNVPPLSDCNDLFGASVARGAWKWKAGAWTTVTQRIKLNDGGKQNGEIEVKADGKTVINLKGLALGGSNNRFQGLMMQSFFGGHEPEWASPKTQDIYLRDFTLDITQTF